MDYYERIGYTCLAIVAVLYLAAMFVGIIVAFPFGLIGLLLIVGLGVLVLKVVRERIANKEDDYYSKHVEK